MNSPLVSIIIPAFNSEKYITEALQSVWKQTYTNYEVIVIDDGSTDKTAEVVQSWKGKIRFFQQANGGISSARNAGIRRAKGAFIAFLDADDIWMPGKLQEQLDFLQVHPEIDIVFSKAQNYIHSDTVSIFDAKSDLPVIEAHVPPNCLFRRELLDRVGMLDESIRDMGEFADWYGRIVNAKIGIGAVPSLLIKRRIHGQNIGILQKHRVNDYLRILHKKIHAEMRDTI